MGGKKTISLRHKGGIWGANKGIGGGEGRKKTREYDISLRSYGSRKGTKGKSFWQKISPIFFSPTTTGGKN